MSTSENTDKKTLALARVRDYLDSCWRWTHQNYLDYGQNFFLEKRTAVPEILASDMCRHTTLFLLHLLEAAGDSARWKVAGGTMSFKGGAGEGDHWWLEGPETVLDLTAEQFGWEPIITCDRNDPRYHRDPELSKKSFVSRLKRTVQQWEGKPTSFWMELDPRFKALSDEYPEVVAFFVAHWNGEAGTHPRACATPDRAAATETYHDCTL